MKLIVRSGVFGGEREIFIPVKPGKKEIFVGKGRQCVIAGMNGTYYVAFISKGRLYCRKPDGKLIELGQGDGYPKLAAVDKSTTLCVWEYENKIHNVLLFI